MNSNSKVEKSLYDIEMEMLGLMLFELIQMGYRVSWVDCDTYNIETPNEIFYIYHEYTGGNGDYVLTYYSDYIEKDEHVEFSTPEECLEEIKRLVSLNDWNNKRRY